MQHLKEHNAVLSEVTDIIEKHIEPGSILIANEGINQHLDFIGHWRLIDASVLKFAAPKPPRIFAPNQNIPTQKILRNTEARLKYADLTGEELFTTFSHDVWQWAAKRHKVYLVANAGQIYRFKSQLSQYDELVTIEKIKLPEVGPDSINMPKCFRPPKGRRQELMAPQGPMGPNQIFDILIVNSFPTKHVLAREVPTNSAGSSLFFYWAGKKLRVSVTAFAKRLRFSQLGVSISLKKGEIPNALSIII